MPIARVEPLTTARALRGPFDYRLPERLGEVGVGSVLLVPFGRRRVIGVVVEVAESSELPPERLAEPIEALEAGATPELVRLGPLGRARVLLDPGSRARAGAAARAWVAAGRGRGPRLERSRRATEAGRAALGDGTRLGPRQRAALERLAGAAAGAELSARQLKTDGGADRQALGRLEARGLISAAQHAQLPAAGDRRRGRPVDADRG